VRYTVEAWAPEYGAPIEDPDSLGGPSTPPDVEVEVPTGDWTPRSPPPETPVADSVLFTDGVRRVDGRVWIANGAAAAAAPRLGVCASYAAGAVLATRRPQPRARVVAAAVDRGLFTAAAGAETIRTRHGDYPVRACAGETAEALALALQQRMGEMEVEVAWQACADGPADVLVVIDGPLRGRQRLPGAVGYVKTHHVAYLPAEVIGVVASLAPAQRTPLFLTTTTWSRYCWYVRLPGGSGHAWAGVVRCEASADLEPAAAALLADRASAALPRFASAAHKDPRAPQNLTPIAGLERTLRHRLGDPRLMYRALVVSAAAVGP